MFRNLTLWEIPVFLVQNFYTVSSSLLNILCIRGFNKEQRKKNKNRRGKSRPLKGQRRHIYRRDKQNRIDKQKTWQEMGVSHQWSFSDTGWPWAGVEYKKSTYIVSWRHEHDRRQGVGPPYLRQRISVVILGEASTTTTQNTTGIVVYLVSAQTWLSRRNAYIRYRHTIL